MKEEIEKLSSMMGSVEKFDADYWVKHPKEFVEKVEKRFKEIRTLQTVISRIEGKLSRHSHQDGKVIAGATRSM